MNKINISCKTLMKEVTFKQKLVKWLGKQKIKCSAIYRILFGKHFIVTTEHRDGEDIIYKEAFDFNNFNPTLGTMLFQKHDALCEY